MENENTLGKRVADLDIDKDRVMMSADVSQVVNDAIKNIKIDSNALSDIVLQVISVNYVTVADYLDGVTDGVNLIDAGGAN